MSGEAVPEVKVELADGVKGDNAELTALPSDARAERKAEVHALKCRIAELFLACEANPHTGERWGRVDTRVG